MILKSQLPMVRKAVAGPCQQGQTSAATGCIPAEGPANALPANNSDPKKLQKVANYLKKNGIDLTSEDVIPEYVAEDVSLDLGLDEKEAESLVRELMAKVKQPKNELPAKPFGGWGSLDRMAREIVNRPDKLVVLRAGQINPNTPNFFSFDAGTSETYGAGHGREVNLWQLDPDKVANLRYDNRLGLTEEEMEELDDEGPDLYGSPPKWFQDRLRENGYSGFTDGSWVRTENASAILGKHEPTGTSKAFSQERRLVTKIASTKILTAIEELGGRGGGLVSIQALGQRLGLFQPFRLHADLAMLRRAGKITMTGAEGRHGLGPGEQAWLMDDSNGHQLGYVSLKRLQISVIRKSEAGPCEQGQTSAKTGCVPAEGPANKLPAQSSQQEADARKLLNKWQIDARDADGVDPNAVAAELGIDPDEADKLLRSITVQERSSGSKIKLPENKLPKPTKPKPPAKKPGAKPARPVTETLPQEEVSSPIPPPAKPSSKPVPVKAPKEMLAPEAADKISEYMTYEWKSDLSGDGINYLPELYDAINRKVPLSKEAWRNLLDYMWDNGAAEMMILNEVQKIKPEDAGKYLDEKDKEGGSLAAVAMVYVKDRDKLKRTIEQWQRQQQASQKSLSR